VVTRATKAVDAPQRKHRDARVTETTKNFFANARFFVARNDQRLSATR
jgi:hypothetical protein